MQRIIEYVAMLGVIATFGICIFMALQCGEPEWIWFGDRFWCEAKSPPPATIIYQPRPTDFPP